MPSGPPQDPGFLKQARSFLQAFWQFAGKSGPPAVLLVMLGAAFEGFGLVLLAPILTVVTANAAPAGFQAAVANALGWAGADSKLAQLGLLLTLFALLMIGRAGVLYVRDLRLAHLQFGFVEDQRIRVIKRLAEASWADVAALRHARISNLLGADIQRLGAATNFAVQGGVAFIVLLVQAAIAVALSPPMAGLAILLLLTGSLFLAPMLRKARDLGGNISRSHLALMTSATSFLSGLKSAKAQDQQDDFVREFETLQANLHDQQVEVMRRQSRSRLVYGLASATVGALVVLISFTLLPVAPEVVITLIVLFARMSGPAMTFQQSAQQMANALPAFQAVRQLEADLGAPGPAHLQALETAPPSGPIRVDNVAFTYPNGRGLKSANLILEPGEFIGLVGPSGGGKTTLADLLTGLIPPQSGDIWVGTLRLSALTLATWRRQVAYVSQETFLFNDTLRRNLDWTGAADETSLWNALEQAGAEDLVRRRGMDWVVGERGILLSGGERQRLALARAMLRKPRLLVLDEATNAIDIEGEAAVLSRLTHLAPRPTIVMIAHRSESLAFCDRVITLRDGRITN